MVEQSRVEWFNFIDTCLSPRHYKCFGRLHSRRCVFISLVEETLASEPLSLDELLDVVGIKMLVINEQPFVEEEAITIIVSSGRVQLTPDRLVALIEMRQN